MALKHVNAIVVGAGAGGGEGGVRIGVAGDMSANPISPPPRKPYPMPAFPLNREGKRL